LKIVKKKATPEPNMALDCQIETIKPIVLKSRVDLSDMNIYVVNVTFDVEGSGAFSFKEGIWDGELSWSFYGDSDALTLSVDGDFRLEMSAVLADFFDKIPYVDAVFDVEFREDGDSPPVPHATCEVIEPGRVRLLALRAGDLE